MTSLQSLLLKNALSIGDSVRWICRECLPQSLFWTTYLVTICLASTSLFPRVCSSFISTDALAPDPLEVFQLTNKLLLYLISPIRHDNGFTNCHSYFRDWCHLAAPTAEYIMWRWLTGGELSPLIVSHKIQGFAYPIYLLCVRFCFF